MKRSILVLSLIYIAAFPSVFAEYTLTTADQAVIKAGIEKVQKKPLRTQEGVIRALKKAQNSTRITAKNKAVYAAMETGLRQKDTSGKLLATHLEKKEILQSLSTLGQEMTGSMEVHIAGNLTSTTQPKNVNFDTTLNVDVDMGDVTNPKVSLRVEADAKADAEKVALMGEARFVENAGFLLLEKLDLVPDESDIAEYIAPYLNTWWKFPMNADMMKADNQTEVQRLQKEKIQTLLTQSNIIPTVIYLGQKEGVSLYQGILDNDALVTLGTHLATAQGETLSATDIREMRDMFRPMKLSTQFTLDAKNTIKKLSITAITLAPIVAPDNSQIRGTVTLEMTSSPLKTPILAPSESKDLNATMTTQMEISQ